MSQVNASVPRLPWASAAANTPGAADTSGQGGITDAQGEVTTSSAGRAPAVATAMDQMVQIALMVVVQDPARAQSYIANGTSGSATDAARTAGTVAGQQNLGGATSPTSPAMPGAPTVGTSPSSVTPDSVSAQYRTPLGTNVSGADLVRLQRNVSPYVGPALRAAGAVIAGGPTGSG
ncbi:MAG: hypothetical protein H7123_02145, partial [Thermoleophilia bacterium]|nr:hypothetical protein [Thermoleophilia bacterium]